MKQSPTWQTWMERNAIQFTDVDFPVTSMAREAACIFGGEIRHDEYESYLERVFYNRARAVFMRLGIDMKRDGE